jgi:gliding motility-associated-like protein
MNQRLSTIHGAKLVPGLSKQPLAGFVCLEDTALMMKTNHSLRHAAILSVLWIASLNLQAQITTDNSLTPEELVALLVGPDVQVSNISFTGTATQRGTFLNNNGNLPIAEGIVLSTGDLALLVGPNNQSGAGANVGGGAYPDLNTLSGVTTFDAAVLEFDFVATGDSLSFNYSFCSEEYNEYVGGGVNDTFGLFLDGPGINGPFANESINLAIIPGSGGTPVSINTVNLDSFSEFYTNNDGSTNPGPNDTQMDGLTVLLEAGSVLQCGETYHIRLCIADGGDGILDSVVLLEAGSFSAGSVNLNASAVPLATDGLENLVPYEEAIGLPAVFSYSNGESFPYGQWSADNNITVEVDGQNVQIDAVIIEGCNDAQFTIIRPEVESELLDTLYLGLEGSAVSGLDFSANFSQVIMQPGQVESEITLGVVDDGVNEGVETVLITFDYINGCGELVTTTSQVVILDPIPIVATPSVVGCQGLDGTQELGYDNIVGYGPFNYNWNGNVWSNATEDPGDWTVSFDSVFVMTDASGHLIPSHIIPLQITDQCGKSVIHEIEVLYPVMFETEICTNDRQEFPAYNAGIPISDVRYNGNSLVNGSVNGVPLTVDANAVGDNWSLEALASSGYQWADTLTLVDTCGYETRAFVRVRECFIPNVFTPDNTTGNNNFRVRGLDGFYGSRLLIYNRYGTLVFEDETKDLEQFELVWDGTYPNGNEAPEGVYQWVLLRSDGHKEHGDLSLFRQR